MDVAYPLKPPIFSSSQIQEKQEDMNHKPWMKQCCLWGERKLSLFHTPSTGLHQFPPPFQPKRKKKRHTPGARKKTGWKLNESKLFKLNKLSQLN